MNGNAKKPEVSVYIAMSLDGFIATKGDGLDWLDIVKVEGEDYGYTEFMKTIDALMLGRNTYDVVRGFSEWPYGGKRVLVFTHRPLSPIRGEEAASGSITETLDKLASEGVRRVYIDGGNLIRSGLKEGVIDRMIVSVIPILLGDGIPLFASFGKQVKLESLGAKRFSSGLVQLSYKVL